VLIARRNDFAYAISLNGLQLLASTCLSEYRATFLHSSSNPLLLNSSRVVVSLYKRLKRIEFSGCANPIHLRYGNVSKI
jgi:hypothetical protein